MNLSSPCLHDLLFTGNSQTEIFVSIFNDDHGIIDMFTGVLKKNFTLLQHANDFCKSLSMINQIIFEILVERENETFFIGHYVIEVNEELNNLVITLLIDPQNFGMKIWQELTELLHKKVKKIYRRGFRKAYSIVMYVFNLLVRCRRKFRKRMFKNSKTFQF